MMKDIEIKISRETRMVDLSKTTIGNDGENLQGNLVFSFTDEFVKGQGRLEYVINGESKYAFLLSDDENYYIPIKSVMTKEGQIDMQLVITEGNDVNEIPIFKSNVFYVSCKKSINAEVEEEEEYYSWIEIANTKLNEVDEAIEELASQSNYAKEQGDYAKEQGTNAKSVAEETEKKAQEGAFDGKSLEFVWEGTKLGVRLEGQEEYHFVDLQGKQGEIGATGEPFKIKKTYASVSEMNADFANMQFGDYVMIASSVNEEDNAKLYTRGESAWIFISDFSGAMGIRGETGLTPNIQIGEVKTLEPGSQAKVTRSGSNEEPVFNFELPKGDKGDDYVLTEEDKVEIGEKVNTEYEKRIEENEKDIADLEATIDILTNTDTKKGELVHITDALPLATFENKVDGNVKQETTKGNQLFDYEDTSLVSNGITVDENGWITATLDNTNGTSSKYLNYWTNISNKLKPSTNYKIVLEVKNISGTLTDITVASTKTGDMSQFSKQQYFNFGNITSNSVYVLDNTTLDDFTNSIYMLRSYVTFGAGKNGSITFRLSVIEDTTVTPETFVYEKYTGGQASPNPEFPQEIEMLEGYNLLPKTTKTNQTIKGIDFVINEDGSITANGTATASTTFYLGPGPTLPKGDYVISSGLKGESNVRFGVEVGTNYYNTTLSRSVTFAEEVVIKSTYYQIDSGKTVNNLTLYPMIIKGINDKPYLPYGCVGYKVNGKNVFDVSQFNGITQNADGSYKTTTYYNDTNETTFKGLPNTNYTISFRNSEMELNSSTFSLAVNGTWVNLANSGHKRTITTDANGEVKLKLGSGSYQLIGTQDRYIQIELGDATEYEPYKEQIVPLDLKGNFIGKIKDTDIEDYLVTDKKNYWLVKNVNRGLISMNNYHYETNIDMWYFFNKPKDSEDYGVYTTNGLCEVAVNSLNKPIRFDGGGNKVQYAIVYKKSQVDKIPTNDEIKELVDGKYFYYKLKEPQIIDLGELPEPIKTFEGTNNIQVLANLDTEIEVKYALDVKKYFENKLASIQEQIL